MSIRIIFVSVLVVCIPPVAYAAHCIPPFDNDEQQNYEHNTVPTSKTEFRWRSDATPMQDGKLGESYHSILNIHEWNLSFDWKKISFQRFFSEPLISGDDDCVIDYGRFKLDDDAPILTSNDGVKQAVAYVPVAGDVEQGPIPAGTRVLLDRDGGWAGITLVYYYKDNYLEVEINSGVNNHSIAMQPTGFGVDIERFTIELEEFGAKIIAISSLSELISGSASGSVLELATEDPFVHFVTPDTIKLNFSDVESMPVKTIPIIIFSSEGNLKYAKGLSMISYSLTQ